MKKYVIWGFVFILTITVFFAVLYVLDMSRMKNNEQVIFSTWGYDYVSPVYATDGITLETVCDMVLSKGENLTWNDFKKYNSTEIGSGLYILLYEVDANYNLMIGGIPSENPMYIRLVLKRDNEQYIDIRYDNINAFLAKHSKEDAAN